MASPSIAPAPRMGRNARARGSVPPAAPIVGPPTNDPAPTVEDALREVRRLFDAGPDSGLTVRVYGEAPSGDAFRELLDSLRMYDDGCRSGSDLVGRAPSRAALAKALATLGGEEQRRRALSDVLSTFGPRLVHPLGDVLEDAPPGSVRARLAIMRDLVLSQVADLRLSPESQRLLDGDVRRLFSDGYLALVADNEEQIERPRVRALAREILRLLGTTFQRAFAALPDAAFAIAEAAAARLAGEHALRDLPVRVRRELTAALEQYLRDATEGELAAALRRLYAEHGMPPVDLPPGAYRDLAERCWEIVASCC